MPSGITAPAATTLPAPDPHPVQQYAPHSDEALVLDRAPVEDHPVPHADPAPTMHGNPSSTCTMVPSWRLVCAPIDDRRHVAANDGAVPDARFLPERHVAHDGGGGRDEGGRMDPRAHRGAGGNSIWVQASTGEPSLSAGCQVTLQTKSRTATLERRVVRGTEPLHVDAYGPPERP